MKKQDFEVETKSKNSSDIFKRGSIIMFLNLSKIPALLLISYMPSAAYCNSAVLEVAVNP